MLSNHAIIKQGGAEISDGIVVKARDANGYAKSVDVYGTVIYPFTLGGGVLPSYGWPYCKVDNFRLMSDVVEIRAGAFSQLTFSEMDFVVPETCTRIEACGGGFKSITTPVGCEVFGDFIRGTRTKKAIILGRQRFGERQYPFYQCSELEYVQLGSLGNPIETMNEGLIFGYCTQVGLIITVYCIGINVDLFVSRIRNGATNATIIIKASEDTTYGGEIYRAGDTIISSTPT